MVIGERTYLVLLAALAGERLFELWLSNRNARRAFARGAIEVGSGHFVAMAAMHTAFLCSCAIESLLRGGSAPILLSTVALLATAIAQFVRYAAVVTLGERWNTRVIVTPGAEPVSSGLYRWIRHPNYVAVAIEIVAVPLIRGCWITAVVFSAANALMLAMRIPFEERAMGQRYEHVFATRPRFIPRIRQG